LKSKNVITIPLCFRGNQTKEDGIREGGGGWISMKKMRKAYRIFVSTYERRVHLAG
jgi:hypothetical protein